MRDEAATKIEDDDPGYGATDDYVGVYRASSFDVTNSSTILLLGINGQPRDYFISMIYVGPQDRIIALMKGRFTMDYANKRRSNHGVPIVATPRDGAPGANGRNKLVHINAKMIVIMV